MPKKSTYNGHWDKPETAPDCQARGCSDKGLYKAPKSATGNAGYYWFCLEHVRAYNQAWDYFRGMPPGDIEDFMKDAVTGHRPTWRIGDQPFLSRALLEEKLHAFLHDGKKPSKTTNVTGLSKKEAQALKLFELELPVDEGAIKKRYKLLVKRYHPDVNRGSKKAEETFKEVTLAYQILLKRFGAQ